MTNSTSLSSVKASAPSPFRHAAAAVGVCLLAATMTPLATRADAIAPSQAVNIDRAAPVMFETSIEIAAPPSVVWAALIDVGQWPSWHQVIDTAELRGPTTPGSVILWTTSGMTINSRLTRVEPGRALDWDGSDGGMRGLHSWRLEPTSYGTRLVNAESMSGGFAAANPAEARRMLTFMLETWNQHLKAHVEKAAAADTD